MWIKFFFGSPQRFLASCIGISASLILVSVFPGVLRSAIEMLMYELSPLIMVAIVCVIIVGAFRMVVAPSKKSKKE